MNGENTCCACGGVKGVVFGRTKAVLGIKRFFALIHSFICLQVGLTFDRVVGLK